MNAEKAKPDNQIKFSPFSMPPTLLLTQPTFLFENVTETAQHQKDKSLFYKQIYFNLFKTI